MANEHVNKVVLGDEVLLDLTGDTSVAADVAAGKTLHLATGAPATGTASYASAPANFGNADKANAILYGAVDSTSTSTAFTATVEGLDALTDGTCIMLHNGVVTSAAGFTVNVNNLGAKKCYNNLTNATQESTIFNIAYTLMLVYAEALDEGNGGWWIYRGYDSNTNTIGYQLRTNSGNKTASDTGYRYRLWFTSADGSKWVPANTSTSTNATSNRTLNTRAIDPFGPIVYRATNGTCNSGAGIGATGIWQQYTLTIGYSYMASGFSLTFPDSVYLRCTPQSDGSAVMQDIVQALPSSNDGKIYIHLGTAYSATNMELQTEHPVYYHDGTGIRIWTGAASSGGPSPSSTTPAMDGTAAVGTSANYARADHVHPTDTTLQATLVSGTNIKTVGSQSLLGSGNLTPANIGAAAASHAHGSITSIGRITSDTAVASGDKLIIADSSASSELKRSGIAFGTSTSTFLRNDGTWAEPAGSVAWSDVTGKPFSGGTSTLVIDSRWTWLYNNGYVDLAAVDTSIDVTTIAVGANLVIGIGGVNYAATVTKNDWTGTDGLVFEANDSSFSGFICANSVNPMKTGQNARLEPASFGNVPVYFTLTVVEPEYIASSVLPSATSSTLGGIKVGSGLSVAADGTLSLDVSSASGVSF